MTPSEIADRLNRIGIELARNASRRRDDAERLIDDAKRRTELENERADLVAKLHELDRQETKRRAAKIVVALAIMLGLCGCASDGARRGGLSILCFDVHIQLGGVSTRGNVPIEAGEAIVTNAQTNSAPLSATLPLMR